MPCDYRECTDYVTTPRKGLITLGVTFMGYIKRAIKSTTKHQDTLYVKGMTYVTFTALYTRNYIFDLQRFY